jgi:signal transduction histidine kinase
VRVSARRADDERVTFSVTDTGIGIAKEHQACIFQDFIQVDPPLQKKRRGSGLGLSLSKKTAELLGGTVGMESEPGVGSSFYVTIPVRIANHNQDLAATKEELVAESNLHVS